MSTSSIFSRQKGTVGKTQSVINLPTTSTQNTPMRQSTKTVYQVAQQVKFLHLQAEVESLLYQLQFMKQQRIAAASYEGGQNHN